MILTEQNYHAPAASLAFMGASQFKAFQKCQASALSSVRGEYQRETTTALLVGSYVDAYFSGSLDLFRAQHPEICKRDGTLKAEYVQADEIIERIERDEVFKRHLLGVTQPILKGQIAGVDFKIKADVLQDDKIVDLKCMRDFEPIWSADEGRRVHFIEAWGYDIQGAIYQEIVRQIRGERLPFIIAAATKEKTPDIGLFSIPQDRLDYCLDLVEHYAPIYNEIKLGLREAERCGKCDYCKSTKVLTGPVDYGEMI